MSRNSISVNRELQEIIRNPELARLGDAYVNFIFSYALTQITGRPVGIKVSDKVLFEASKKAGLRPILPRRMKRGNVANIVEALIVKSWINKTLSIDEMINIISNHAESLPDAAARLLYESIERMRNGRYR